MLRIPRRVALAFVTVAFLVGACSDSSSSAAGAAGAGDASAPHADTATTGDASTDDPTAPRVMARIGNFMRPEFLALDACFAASKEGPWIGPIWRVDDAHVTYGRIGGYARIAPTTSLVRFVEQGSATCNAPLTGVDDEPVTMPALGGAGTTTWLTITAIGATAALGTSTFAAKTFVDREANATTPFGLRLLPLDPRLGPLEAGSIPNLNNNGYDRRISSVAYASPSAYTSWDATYGGPLYSGFKIFLDGTGKSTDTGGAPLIVGDRAQSDATQHGSWTIFVVPAAAGGAGDSWSFCADGADAPRLCYPCGTPGCEGK